MWKYATVLAAILLSGCDEGAGQVALRSASLPASQSPDLGCDVPATLPPGGILAVDTSLTPRADLAAETLAMEASGELVAPQALYERVRGELALIGRGAPVMGCGAPGELLLGVTAAGHEQIQNGAYTAWDDYNAALKMTTYYLKYASGEYISYKIKFDGVYNLATLAQAYGELPEMRWAQPNSYIGGSVDACLERFGGAADTHVYIFWYGSGDCPSGCMQGTYHGYAAGASGALEYLGEYTRGAAQPDWFSKAQQCRNFLLQG